MKDAEKAFKNAFSARGRADHFPLFMQVRHGSLASEQGHFTYERQIARLRRPPRRQPVFIKGEDLALRLRAKKLKLGTFYRFGD